MFHEWGWKEEYFLYAEGQQKTGISTLKGGGTGTWKERGYERHQCMKVQLTQEEKQCRGCRKSPLLAVLKADYQ